MHTESTIDAIKLGVEYIMIVIFIGLAIKVLALRNDYANSLNEQEISEANLKETLEFSMYNTGIDQNNRDEWMTGDEVVACFRKYRNGSVQVYLDKAKDGSSLLLNSQTFQNKSILNGREVNTFSLEYLLTAIDMSSFYHPYLVYDDEDITNPDSYQHSGASVSGITFMKVCQEHP